LLGAIKFKDAATVTAFKNWMKIVLSDYSIVSESLLEQYKSSEGESTSVITKIILKNR